MQRIISTLISFLFLFTPVLLVNTSEAEAGSGYSLNLSPTINMVEVSANSHGIYDDHNASNSPLTVTLSPAYQDDLLYPLMMTQVRGVNSSQWTDRGGMSLESGRSNYSLVLSFFEFECHYVRAVVQWYDEEVFNSLEPGQPVAVAMRYGTPSNEHLVCLRNAVTGEVSEVPNDVATVGILLVDIPGVTMVREITYAPIAWKTLPEQFAGETTSLSDLNVDNSTNVENFILDTSDVKITFQESLDLSGEEVATKFEELNNYVIVSKGKIEVKSSELPQLNKKAKIEMKGLNLKVGEGENPVVVRIGEDGKRTLIENAKYESGILVFEVDGFSTYLFQPSLGEVKVTTENGKVKINGSVNDLDSKVEVTLGDKKVEAKVNEDGKFELEEEFDDSKELKVSVTVTSVNGESDEFSEVIKAGTKPAISESDSDNNTLMIVIAVAVALTLIVAGVALVKRNAIKSYIEKLKNRSTSKE